MLACLWLVASTTAAQAPAPGAAPAPPPLASTTDAGAAAPAPDATLAPTTTEPAPQPPASTEPLPQPSASTEPTAEELAALQKALGADASTSPSAATAANVVGAAAQQALTSTAAMNPDIALIMDVAGAYFSSDENLQSGGHDPRATGFTLQQVEMSLGANVDPFVRLDANIVFAQFGVEVEEAVATTTSLPYNLQLRGGQFLTRIGRQNNTHPHTWKFVDQPLVFGKFFGAENNRGLGAEASWLVPLPWFVEVVASATTPDGECCARSYYGGSGLKVAGPEDVVATGALKQFFPLSDDVSLLWGLSAQGGPNPTGQKNRTEVFGTDLYLRYRPVDDPGRGSLSLTTEVFARRRQVPDAVLADVGGYAQVVAQWALQYEAGVRAELVTGVNDDPLDPTWTGPAHRYSAQATFYPSHFSRVRAQTSVAVPPDGAPPVVAAMLALEVLIGAHGSHAF
jgi:hypothetical protein